MIVLSGYAGQYLPGGLFNRHEWLQDKFTRYEDELKTKQAAAKKYRDEHPLKQDEFEDTVSKQYTSGFNFMRINLPNIIGAPVCFDICLKHGEMRNISCK